jgi:Transposase DDE domain
LKIEQQSFIETQSKFIGQIIGKHFSEEAINRMATKSGFIKRSRKLSASQFVNTLMFLTTSQAHTSLPEIAADLCQQFSVDISKEGIHKRFSPQAVSFLKEMIKSQLSERLPQASFVGWGTCFTAINIKDSSKFALPGIYKDTYPGFGNFHMGQGVMNIQYEYDLMSGNWKTLELTSIKTNDQQDSRESIDRISKGELYLRDLGYVTPFYLKSIIDKKAFFLNRLPAQVLVRTTNGELIDWKHLDRKFKKTSIPVLDLDVQVYEKDSVACRMIVERVDDALYRDRIRRAERTAKRHGVGLTEKHRIRCRYNTFITNIERKNLQAKMIRRVYYLRWQIELVFKTWKSNLQINKLKRVKKERLECQLLARLLWALLNWRLLQCCNNHIRTKNKAIGVSTLKFFKRCLVFSNTLRLVVLKKLTLCLWLTDIFLPLIQNTACEPPATKTTHFETLYQLGLS